MKNIIKIFGLFIVLIGFNSCEDVLERKPLDKISDGDVWESESLLNGYVLDLYNRLPAKEFNRDWYYTEESTNNSSNDNAMTRGTMDKDNTLKWLEYWDYNYIRDCNIFLEKIAATPISDSKKMQFEGEVRAMRAFAYFEMAKRYGGVPLVTTVIDPFGTIDPKDQMRAKEEAIYDFVDAEYVKAIELLEGTADAVPTARINKWSALALKARADLWAASIAKYGTVQLDGLVGVTASRANEFYGKASDAANAVIGSGLYALYNANQADLAKNYQNIFLDEGNSEILFAREYNGSEVKHSWDHDMAPRNFCSGMGHQCNPVLNLILQYENVDGSVIDYEQLFNKDHLFTDALELFKGKDPRLFATVLMQGSIFNNEVMQFYDGIDTAQVPNLDKITRRPTITYKGFLEVGTDSRRINEMNTNSNLLCRKFLDEPVLPIAVGTSQVDWPIMRLAEVYLTKAEADFQTGNVADAVTALNMTRARAGITKVDASTISLQKIQNEWLVEFAFEGKRFWDLRRWRTAETVLNNTQIRGLYPIWHFASNKFYFLVENAEPFIRVFRQQHYYNPISTARINNNTYLKQNPLY